MVTTDSTGDVKSLICKQLSKLPPVVSEWQESCHQPRCTHFCDGECGNSSRESAAAPCPYDGKELPLMDANSRNDDLDETEADLARPWPTTPALPKKG